MTIRPLLSSDYETVLNMMRLFYASNALLIHPEEGVLRRTLGDAIGENPYLQGYGFETEEGLAGYGMVAMSYSTEAGGLCAWIEDIYVSPPWREKGFGTVFLNFVQSRYKDRVVRIRLEAEPENERAMAVYRKAGYEILGYTQLVKEINNERTD